MFNKDKLISIIGNNQLNYESESIYGDFLLRSRSFIIILYIIIFFYFTNNEKYPLREGQFA